MKIILTAVILLLSSLTLSAQVDTIYSGGKRIPCKVVEVTEQSVKFIYPNEDLVNSLYNNAIEKIVFKSGRVQTFASATTFKTLTSPDDWDNITLSHLESELVGLYKLGDTGAKAKGTTEFSSQERVKQRAMRKFKAKAAMMGGNVIYMLNIRQEGLKYNYWTNSSSSTETNLTGIVYTSVLPQLDDLKKIIGSKTSMTATMTYRMANSDPDYSVKTTSDTFTIKNVGSDNGILYVEGEIRKGKPAKYKVSFVNENDFYVYYQDKDVIYAYKIQ